MTAEGAARGEGVGLYVHVPFCHAICTYCAFARTEYDRHRADAYLDGLEAEIRFRAEHTWGRPRVDTIFLGGGTPSALAADQWRRLGALLAENFDWAPELEFTSEANPESLTPARAGVMVEVGVNRLSLGVQSTRPAELNLLGRIHDAAGAARAVAAARDAGIANLNLDLMYALPGQTEADFEESLETVLALDPEHLSAYCLGLEPGTPLASEVASGRLPRPGDDRARVLYDLLVRRTEASGRARYEISNFARPGRACRHNLRYWRRRDVLALGPSAHGLRRNRRWANPAPLEAWLAAYVPGGRAPVPRRVEAAEACFEWIFLNLRLARGLDPGEYRRLFDREFEADHGATVAGMVAKGLLRREAGRLVLGEEAWFLSDGVFAEFAPRGPAPAEPSPPAASGPPGGEAAPETV